MQRSLGFLAIATFLTFAAPYAAWSVITFFAGWLAPWVMQSPDWRIWVRIFPLVAPVVLVLISLVARQRKQDAL